MENTDKILKEIFTHLDVDIENVCISVMTKEKMSPLEDVPTILFKLDKLCYLFYSVIIEG